MVNATLIPQEKGKKGRGKKKNLRRRRIATYVTSTIRHLLVDIMITEDLVDWKGQPV